VRFLETLVAEGYVANDPQLGGYCVTSLVPELSSGFHSGPLVVEAGREACAELTRRFKWPASLALLEGAAVSVKYSTIPDSPISPFHATLNMRLSLISRALGRAYIAWCPEAERAILINLLRSSPNPEDQVPDLEATIAAITRQVRSRGFAERDPGVEPRNSGTIAVPILHDERVMATMGLTFFRSAVPPSAIGSVLAPALLAAARDVEARTRALVAERREG
jgi:IclR family mhp operon transcriptional activator